MLCYIGFFIKCKLLNLSYISTTDSYFGGLYIIFIIVIIIIISFTISIIVLIILLGNCKQLPLSCNRLISGFKTLI